MFDVTLNTDNIIACRHLNDHSDDEDCSCSSCDCSEVDKYDRFSINNNRPMINKLVEEPMGDFEYIYKMIDQSCTKLPSRLILSVKHFFVLF
jgi:hypothetical protein